MSLASSTWLTVSGPDTDIKPNMFLAWLRKPQSSNVLDLSSYLHEGRFESRSENSYDCRTSRGARLYRHNETITVCVQDWDRQTSFSKWFGGSICHSRCLAWWSFVLEAMSCKRACQSRQIRINGSANMTMSWCCRNIDYLSRQDQQVHGSCNLLCFTWRHRTVPVPN